MGLEPLITRNLNEIMPEPESGPTGVGRNIPLRTSISLSFFLYHSHVFLFLLPQLLECDPIFNFVFRHGAFLQTQDISGLFTRSSLHPPS
jgi:hypothetical protein